ncbi:MAG: SWIM zinc finger family protein [Pyrinomonadaceae bacterium]|nr:SWIM zinc finger family protein [Pyrinomonadaceae bacterium]
MMNINANRMGAVVAAALAVVRDHKRWTSAIIRAAIEIEKNPYMHMDGRSLMVLSPSDQIYVAGAECQCESFRRGNPCWHLAAARLLKRYDEATA